MNTFLILWAIIALLVIVIVCLVVKISNIKWQLSIVRQSLSAATERINELETNRVQISVDRAARGVKHAAEVFGNVGAALRKAAYHTPEVPIIPYKDFIKNIQ